MKKLLSLVPLILLTGCYEPDGGHYVITGIASRLKPHDCVLKTDQTHVEMVSDAASKLQEAGCFTIAVEVIDEPSKEPHHVVFTSPIDVSELNGSVHVFENEINRLNREEHTDIDVRHTLLHELGHHFGLRHADDRDSVMYANPDPGRNLLELQEIDIAALQELCSGN